VPVGYWIRLRRVVEVCAVRAVQVEPKLRGNGEIDSSCGVSSAVARVAVLIHDSVDFPFSFFWQRAHRCFLIEGLSIWSGREESFLEL
jgi:hypothetical protein